MAKTIKPFVKKKWGSFEEMRNDLVSEGILQLEGGVSKNEQDNIVIADLYKVVEGAQNAKSSKDFFDATCHLSSFFEKINDESLKSVFVSTNLYVLLLNAVFRNTKFQQELTRVSEAEISLFGNEVDGLNIESKKFINAGISLAFFSIANGLSVLRDSNIIFLRKNLTDLVRYILRNSSGKNTFTNLCFKLESISSNNRYYYTDKFPINLDDKKLFNALRLARSVSGVSFLSLTINSALSSQFSKINETFNTDEFSLSKALLGIYGLIYRLEKSEESYYEGFSEVTTKSLRFFFEIFIRNNERILLFLLKKISADFQFQQDKKFSEVVLNKIKSSESLRGEIIYFAGENLKAYKGDIGEDGYEWSNKVFIASLRLLSVLSGINSAKDEKWMVSTAIHEFREWINDVHNILNKYSIEDDWALVQDFVDQETTEVEWKSTFFTPLEQIYVNDEADIGVGKKLFEKIIKTILGMLNTEGGVLIIGLIENPELIARKELAKNIIFKNGKTFFDVSSELKRLGKSLDQVRLQIFNSLKALTDNSPEKFNNLITLEPILLKDGQSSVTVIKIQIKKSEGYFYNVKKEGGAVTWISLTMRAQGQTVDVDIRDHI